jgi:hypothetical protein
MYVRKRNEKRKLYYVRACTLTETYREEDPVLTDMS